MPTENASRVRNLGSYSSFSSAFKLSGDIACQSITAYSKTGRFWCNKCVGHRYLTGCNFSGAAKVLPLCSCRHLNKKPNV